MSSLTNAGTALGMSARTNRGTVAIWTSAIVALVAGVTAGVEGLYPTALDRAAYAAVSTTTSAAHALNGPPTGLTTLGGIAVFEAGWYLTLAVAALNIVLVARNSRGAEELGRLELLRSGVLGIHANLAAVLTLVTAANLAIGLGSAGMMIACGAAWKGAAVFGACQFAIGTVFAAVTAVAAQITEHVRGTYAIAGTALGASYAVRAVGDASGNEVVSWFSPLGWAQATHPFGDDRWWPLLVSAVATVGLVSTALLLESRRDHGGGLISPRPGPPTASNRLAEPIGLAGRLYRGAGIAWIMTAAGLGLAFGAVGKDTGKLGESSAAMLDLIGGFGSGDLIDSYFAMSALFLAIIASASALSAVLRTRAEEQSGRADTLLATPFARWRWLTSHLAVAAITSGAVLVIGGASLGLAHGVRTGELSAVPRMVGAAIAHAPAVWLLLGIATLLIGLVPRLTAVAWVVFAGSAVASILGGTLRLPSYAMDLSPFEHTPRLPGSAASALLDGGGQATATALLIALAAILIVLGLIGFRRRDIG